MVNITPMLDSKNYDGGMTDATQAFALTILNKLDLSPYVHILNSESCHSFYLMWQLGVEIFIMGIWTDSAEYIGRSHKPLEHYRLPNGRKMFSYKRLSIFTRDYSGLVKSIKAKIDQDDELGIFVYEDSEAEQESKFIISINGMSK